MIKVPRKKIPVYVLQETPSPYKQQRRASSSFLRQALSEIFDLFPIRKVSGTTVLVKPNLLKAGDPLCVTPGDMILETAALLKDGGARVVIGDSPAFGNAQKVLNSLGILKRLKDMDAKVCSLKKPVPMELPCGIKMKISKTALEADTVVNIPRLKAHCQMGITSAVKNTFGTVVGFRKALAHTLYGGDRELFSAMILDISKLFPNSINIVDARTVMHVTGPSGGLPFSTGIVAASPSAVAVDTCLYQILGLRPETVPLWKRALEQKVPGCEMEELYFPKRDYKEIYLKERPLMPQSLEPLTFNPFRFLRGRIRSLMSRVF